jgi:hypothetical protein
MAEPTDHEREMDILDKIFMSEDYDDIDIDPDLYLDDLIEKDLVLSENIQPISNLVTTVSQDIPRHPNEWLVTDRISRRLRPPRLYEFLYLLLQKPSYASYASYKDKSQGIFQVHEPEKIAELWQQIKSRQSNQKMTYDNFARAIRWYYKKDIMKKTNARYTFQFSSTTLQEFINDEKNNVGLGYSNVNQQLIGIFET